MIELKKKVISSISMDGLELPIEIRKCNVSSGLEIIYNYYIISSINSELIAEQRVEFNCPKKVLEFDEGQIIDIAISLVNEYLLNEFKSTK